MNWPLSNWQRWKHKEAARELGLRLVHSRPAEFVNPYPCAVGLVPPTTHIGTRVELRTLSRAEYAAEFVRRHAKRSLGDDAA